MTIPRIRIGIGAAMATLLLSSGAGAQDAAGAPDGADQVLIPAAPSGVNGVRQMNAAAGSRNQQLNMGVIAVGDAAVATGMAVQAADNPALSGDRSASAAIASGAFANSNGLTAVNASAGSDNQQINMALAAIGLEGRVVTDVMLLQTRASHEPSDAHQSTAAPERTATIGQGAFANSSGIVQVSLIGGERNSSANLAVLSMEASIE